MKKFLVLVLLLMAVICLCPEGAFAETVTLKSGRVVDAEILERTDEYVKVDFKGVGLTFYMDEVKAINGERVVPTAGAKSVIKQSVSKGDTPDSASSTVNLSPSETWQRYRKLVAEGDVQGLKPFLREDFFEELEQEPEMIMVIQFMTPADAQIHEEKVLSDNQAYLLLTGKQMGSESYGRIDYVKVNGKWVLDKEAWSNTASAWDPSLEERELAGEQDKETRYDFTLDEHNVDGHRVDFKFPGGGDNLYAFHNGIKDNPGKSRVRITLYDKEGQAVTQEYSVCLADPFMGFGSLAFDMSDVNRNTIDNIRYFSLQIVDCPKRVKK